MTSSPRAESPTLETVRERRRAAALLGHPVRLEILEHAREPRSATEIAGRLGQPRQRVNHHVRELARHGFLVKAERRRRRNMIEQRYRASARAYVLAPELLDPNGPAPEVFQDALSAGRLLALGLQLQRELCHASEEAALAGKRLSTLSITSEVVFADAAQRVAFALALERAVLGVIAEHASPARDPEGHPVSGRAFRLLLGLYPVSPSGGAR